VGSHNRKLGKWILVLSKFDLRYESAKAIKGQVMADFVAQDCSPEVSTIELAPWTLFFDGSSCVKGCGIGVILISPGGGGGFDFCWPIDSTSTNNQGEYQAVLIGI